MERKVKTMSGKPHTPRELIADKDITPQEAMHRKMMRAEMDDSSFREEVTEIAWGDMTDREPFDDEETIDKLYEYSMKAYAFDEGLSNEDLQIIWKGAEGESFDYSCQVCDKPIKDGVNMQDIDVHFNIVDGSFDGSYEMKNHLDNYNDFYCMECYEKEGFGAEGHGTVSKYINKNYSWVTEQNPHPHEDMIDEGNVTEEMDRVMEEALDEGNTDSWIGHTHYMEDEDGNDIEVEVSGVFNSEGESHYTKTWKDIMEADDKYPITRGIFWGGVVGLTLPWVIDQIKSRREGA